MNSDVKFKLDDFKTKAPMNLANQKPLPVVDLGLMKWVRLLFWNLRSITLGSSYVSLSDTFLLPAVLTYPFPPHFCFLLFLPIHFRHSSAWCCSYLSISVTFLLSAVPTYPFLSLFCFLLFFVSPVFLVYQLVHLHFTQNSSASAII